MFERQPVGESLPHSVSVGPAVQRLAILRRRLNAGRAFARHRRWQHAQAGDAGERVRLVVDVHEGVVIVLSVGIVVRAFIGPGVA